MDEETQELTHEIKHSVMLRVLDFVSHIQNPVVEFNKDRHVMALAVIVQNKRNAEGIEDLLDPLGGIRRNA